MKLRLFLRLHFVALALLVVAAVGIEEASRLGCSFQREDAQVASAEGLLKGYSQRIASLALRQEGAQGDRNLSLRVALADALAAMEEARETVAVRLAPHGTFLGIGETARQLYFQDPVKLDGRIREFLFAAGKVVAAPPGAVPEADLGAVVDGAEAVSMGIDRLSREYDREAQARRHVLERVGWGLLALLLLVAVGEGWGIFRPVFRRAVGGERRIGRTRSELAILLDATTDAILVVDREFRIVRANKAAGRAWGIEPSRLAGRDAASLVADGPALERAVRHTPQGERIAIEAVRRDGETFRFEFKVSEFETEGRSLLVFAGQDATRRRNHDLRLCLYEQALLHSSDPILVWESGPDDPGRRRITFVNPAFVQATGWQPAEALRRAPDEILAPDATAEERAAFLAVLEAPIRQQCEVPITGHEGKAFWGECIVAPATDDAGVTHHVGIVRDVTERRERLRREREEGFLDPVTGLHNRRHFTEEIARLAGEAREGERRLALLFVDLDGFKAVNDTWGHDAGDALLRLAGLRFRSILRPGDLLCRIAGDEFVAILDRVADRAEAGRIAARAVEALGRPYAVFGHQARVTASIGVAFAPDDGTEPEMLVRQADAAMYLAKREGKGRYCFTSGAPEERVEAGFVKSA